MNKKEGKGEKGKREGTRRGKKGTKIEKEEEWPMGNRNGKGNDMEGKSES